MSSTSKLVTNSLSKLHWGFPRIDFVDRRGYRKFYPQILTHSDFKPLAINMVHKFAHIIIGNQIAQLKYDPRLAGEQIVIDVIDVRQ